MLRGTLWGAFYTCQEVPTDAGHRARLLREISLKTLLTEWLCKDSSRPGKQSFLKAQKAVYRTGEQNPLWWCKKLTVAFWKQKSWMVWKTHGRAVHPYNISSLTEALISGNVEGNALILPPKYSEKLMNWI